MFESYMDRLSLLREWLDSPQPATVWEAYDLLFSLFREYYTDSEFCEELREIVAKHPDLTQDFINRLNKLDQSEEAKASLLKSIVLLSAAGASEETEVSTRDRTPKLFISYSHKDEALKNELLSMLAGLQRRGVIDIWQDRRIEPGSHWYKAIKTAMDECSVALLLVSRDFIASRFIQEEELFKLFARHVKDGLLVIPIIVRACLWQSEPFVKDLQVLPQDGKPVISFSSENGDRDEVWAAIGKEIERLAQGI